GEDAAPSFGERRAERAVAKALERGLERVVDALDVLEDRRDGERLEHGDGGVERDDAELARRPRLEDLGRALEGGAIVEVPGALEEEIGGVLVAEPAGEARHELAHRLATHVEEPRPLDAEEPFVAAGGEEVDVLDRGRDDAERLDRVDEEARAVAVRERAHGGDGHGEPGLELDGADGDEARRALCEVRFERFEAFVVTPGEGLEREEVDLEAERLRGAEEGGDVR